jgi:hypothetical protein
MIDWSSAGESAVSTLSVVCVFLLGMFFSMALLLRLFINQLSLDVRDLPPRLQSLVLLDNITFQILYGEETPYATSIRTGKSLDEVNAEIQVEREAQLQRNEVIMKKEQEDTDKAMAIVKAFGLAFLSIIGGLVFLALINYLIQIVLQ